MQCVVLTNELNCGTLLPRTPEADRYHLYISYLCPWANRCLAVRNMKGLQNVIGLSVVHPTWQVRHYKVSSIPAPHLFNRLFVFTIPTENPSR